MGHCIGDWICTKCLIRFHRTTLLQASKTDLSYSPMVEHLPGPLIKPQRQVETATLRVGDQEASSYHKLSHFRGTLWCSQCAAWSSLLARFKLLGKECQGPTMNEGGLQEPMGLLRTEARAPRETPKERFLGPRRRRWAHRFCLGSHALATASGLARVVGRPKTANNCVT